MGFPCITEQFISLIFGLKKYMYVNFVGDGNSGKQFLNVKKYTIGKLKFCILLVMLSSSVLDCFGGKWLLLDSIFCRG